ncbi:GNAT family N-acetyltransferase [Lelliottia amnigena]|jgi:GNAT superfamily N-acetyltransferase|uniref:GNAT family N-acetyltransferase n=1 Tax=Lelliottia amnigena TaxID=61646 RepID=UPI001C5C9B27|nr:GNAT family N-acetyltransferase [Lelliottia amnigena]MCE9965677.1 GNAT family N-acetyltransferase [Lelliottia amnigena]QXZ17895.1 GNAT family N-acetyltransferase [Lelliottia amnigena]
MTLRRAVPEEAEKLWQIRNLAIRAGCQSNYDAEVIDRWTPDLMPESYRQVVIDNPFFVAVDENGEPVATGYLDLAMNSMEAVFTAPNATGKGLAGAIIAAIKAEARQRGITRITLSSTPNAHAFYLKQGFSTLGENLYVSKLAGAELRSVDMAIDV